MENEKRIFKKKRWRLRNHEKTIRKKIRYLFPVEQRYSLRQEQQDRKQEAEAEAR